MDDLAVLVGLAPGDGQSAAAVQLLDARPEAWHTLLAWLYDTRLALLAAAPCSDPHHEAWDALALWDATEQRVRDVALRELGYLVSP